jgi:hypothetical protein
MHASFAVLRGDCERDINDIGSLLFNCHDMDLSPAHAGIVLSGVDLMSSLTFFIYYLIKNEKNQIKIQTLMISST